jgi:hypothetical protein
VIRAYTPTDLLEMGEVSYVFLRRMRMNLIYEILREKELQLGAVKRQVEALRIVAPLLMDTHEIGPKISAQPDNPVSHLEGTTGSPKGRSPR